MATKKVLKPKAYSLLCASYDVAYKCGKCDHAWQLVQPGFNYCPYCGSKIDWGVVYRVNEEWRAEFVAANKEREKEMLDDLNRLNTYITDGEPRKFPTTQTTKDANKKSNIRYYLGMGWTKEELIKEGRFKEEDFDFLEELRK